jgi:hypothetical protein
MKVTKGFEKKKQERRLKAFYLSVDRKKRYYESEKERDSDYKYESAVAQLGWAVNQMGVREGIEYAL